MAGLHGGQLLGLHFLNLMSGGFGHGIVSRHAGMFSSGGVGQTPAHCGSFGSAGSGHTVAHAGFFASHALGSHGLSGSGTPGSLGGSEIGTASQSNVST